VDATVHEGSAKAHGTGCKSNLAISIEVMLKLMEYLQNEIATASDEEERDFLIGVSAYSVLSFCVPSQVTRVTCWT
jgi:hypothetical protein